MEQEGSVRRSDGRGVGETGRRIETERHDAGGVAATYRPPGAEGSQRCGKWRAPPSGSARPTRPTGDERSWITVADSGRG